MLEKLGFKLLNMIFIHVLKLISLTYKTTLLCVCSISHRIYSVIVAHKIITNYTDEGGGVVFHFLHPCNSYNTRCHTIVHWISRGEGVVFCRSRFILNPPILCLTIWKAQCPSRLLPFFGRYLVVIPVSHSLTLIYRLRWFQILGIVCLALASPARLPGTNWFLFVVIISFIATAIWSFIYLLSIREAINFPINWVLTVNWQTIQGVLP